MLVMLNCAMLKSWERRKGKMDLHKFGIKLFIKNTNNYSSKKFIPIFHKWIQNKSIPNHLLIDVADYSHIVDGPGIMLVAHEGQFSLDQENRQPGMMYMRKESFDGSFVECFHFVFAMAQHASNLLATSSEGALEFSKKSIRFIANDRRLVENNVKNRELYQDKISKIIKDKFPNNSWEYSAISNEDERLAFTVDFTSDININE